MSRLGVHWGVRALTCTRALVWALCACCVCLCVRVQAHWLKVRVLLVGLAGPETAFLSSRQGPCGLHAQGLPRTGPWMEDSPMQGSQLGYLA